MDEKELLLKLLSFDTQNASAFEDSEGNYLGKTMESLVFVKNYLESKGAEVRIIEYEADGIGSRGVLIASRKEPKKDFILLQGHIDIVPFNKEKWDHDPLGEIDSNNEDIIWGRGTVDMKGPLTSLIKAFEELLEKDSLNYEPLLVITSDEEARGFLGIKEFLKKYEDLSSIKFGICAEPTNFELKPFQKGLIIWTLRTKGVEAHGSRPHQGVNAIYKMIPVLNDLLVFKDFVFSQKSDELGNSTMNLGMIRGGVKTNQVPGDCKINFETRLTVNSSIIKKGFEELVASKNKELSYEILFEKNPVIIDKKNVFIKKLENSLKENGKEIVFSVMTGFTEAIFLNSTGIPTIVFGPGNSDYSHSEGKERISVKDVITYKNIIKELFE